MRRSRDCTSIESADVVSKFSIVMRRVLMFAAIVTTSVRSTILPNLVALTTFLMQ